MEIIKQSAIELWKDALQYIFAEGTEHVDNTKRVCKEVLHLNLLLKDNFSDIQGPIDAISSSKKWIYPRLQEIAAIMLEGNLSKSYAYSYGERIFSFSEQKINQVDHFIIPLLKKDPNSRRAVISLWNPEFDSDISRKVVPGLINIDFKLREGKLHLSAIVRSNDIFIGWPANVYQLYVLGNYVANKLQVTLGSIATFSMSAHIFKENYADIKKML